MAIVEILKMGHPQLTRRADAVIPGLEESLGTLVEDMTDTMHAAGGIGIAAPQIGISLRVVVIDIPPTRLLGEESDEVPEAAGGENRPSVLVNPEILPLGNEIRHGWEGCLSLPGLRGLVPRHHRVRYRFHDLSGKVHEGQAEGLMARVLQHECDHLDGILYPQRMDDLRYLVYESEMKHYRRNDKEVQNDAGNG